MIFEIDGREIKKAADFHDKLIDVPGMPDFYGKNFSAFYDVLIGFIEGPFKIVWTDAAISKKHLGQDFDVFIRVMEKAANYTSNYDEKFEFEIID